MIGRYKSYYPILKDNIEVKYSHGFSICKGTLTIKINGKTIYSKGYCMQSTGYANPWMNPPIVSGKMIWEDADKFDGYVQLAVKEYFKNFPVCCGACI